MMRRRQYSLETRFALLTTWRQREVESAHQRLFSKHVMSPMGKKGNAPQKAYLRSFNAEEPKLDVQVSSMEK